MSYPTLFRPQIVSGRQTRMPWKPTPLHMTSSSTFTNSSHCHRSPVAWINRRSLTILVHTYRSRSCFSPCSLFCPPRVWSPQHEIPAPYTDNSRRWATNSDLVGASNAVVFTTTCPCSEWTLAIDQRNPGFNRNIRTKFHDVKLQNHGYPPDATDTEKRKHLSWQLTGSPRNDREKWWIRKCKKMEKAGAVGNSRNL